MIKMMNIFKKIFGKKKETCFACVVEENNLIMDFSYTHDCGKTGSTKALAYKNTHESNDNNWYCTSCNTNNISKQSSMDRTLCDPCWHTLMASTFTSTAFL